MNFPKTLVLLLYLFILLVLTIYVLPGVVPGPLGYVYASHAYNHKMDIWTDVPPMPNPFSYGTVSACTLNGKLYVLGIILTLNHSLSRIFNQTTNHCQKTFVFQRYVERYLALSKLVKTIQTKTNISREQSESCFNHDVTESGK